MKADGWRVRLVEAVLKYSDPWSNSYRYDPFNYRISKSESRGSRADYLEGEHLEASYNGALPTARYMRGVVCVFHVMPGRHFT